ncbi:MAG: hypothetical protein ACR2PL_26600 [Dehalococcoidia bacterium]
MAVAPAPAELPATLPHTGGQPLNTWLFSLVFAAFILLGAGGWLWRQPSLQAEASMQQVTPVLQPFPILLPVTWLEDDQPMQADGIRQTPRRDG